MKPKRIYRLFDVMLAALFGTVLVSAYFIFNFDGQESLNTSQRNTWMALFLGCISISVVMTHLKSVVKKQLYCGWIITCYEMILNLNKFEVVTWQWHLLSKETSKDFLFIFKKTAIHPRQLTIITDIYYLMELTDVEIFYRICWYSYLLNGDTSPSFTNEKNLDENTRLACAADKYAVKMCRTHFKATNFELSETFRKNQFGCGIWSHDRASNFSKILLS